MKRTLFLIAAMALAANIAMAQNDSLSVTAVDSEADSTVTVDIAEQAQAWPKVFIGIRGGVNFSDMKYTHDMVDRYKHFLQPQGQIGLFGHFQLGQSGFSLRPEVTFIGRADSLEWYDVKYRMKARYMDLRLPIVYNFRLPDNHVVSPYLMVVPQLNLAYGGMVSYHADDFLNGVTAPITRADINRYDAGLMLGAGVDFLIPTGGIPVLLSAEAGYNFGLCNTFAQREIKDNPDVAADNRSIIRNNFFGAELWQEKRYNRGIEVALRIALPIDDSWRNAKEPLEQAIDEIKTIDTVIVENSRTDTIYITIDNTREPDTVVLYRNVDAGSFDYIRKDCYSFSEIYSFITLGIDISDKRMCFFNINFDFDSYRLRSESKQPLDEVVMMMKAYPEMKIEVYGHTDSIGSDSYNENLSLQRAKSVVRYIQSRGIDGSRMTAVGYGEKYPIATNSTSEGRFKNRRVEIEVLNVGLRNTDGSKPNNEE